MRLWRGSGQTEGQAWLRRENPGPTGKGDWCSKREQHFDHCRLQTRTGKYFLIRAKTGTAEPRKNMSPAFFQPKQPKGVTGIALEIGNRACSSQLPSPHPSPDALPGTWGLTLGEQCHPETFQSHLAGVRGAGQGGGPRPGLREAGGRTTEPPPLGPFPKRDQSQVRAQQSRVTWGE